MPSKPKKPKVKFTRVLLPPAKFHTTKKGKRGYTRDKAKKEIRIIRQGNEAETP
jgi:hypothetical protein